MLFQIFCEKIIKKHTTKNKTENKNVLFHSYLKYFRKLII